MDGKQDLWIAVIVMMILSFTLAGLTCRLSRHLKTRMIHTGITILVVLLLLSIFVFANSVTVARLVPLPCLPVCGNPALPIAMMICALLLHCRIPLLRRIPLVIILGTVVVSSILSPLIKKTSTCANYWEDDVCIQTRATSCSAAASATLLNHHGIKTTEQEMANLSLTTAKGTRFHGFYRGLLIKTKGTPYKVKGQTLTVSELQNLDDLPAIISVKLTEKINKKEPRYQKDWGWTVGTLHAVVILSFPDNKSVLVADPSYGKERWDISGLEDLMVGDCVVLTERKDS